MKLKVIRPKGEIQEMDLSPTDQIAMPLGTTIIGPDHWDKLVAVNSEADTNVKTEADAADKIAASLGTSLSAALKSDLEKKPVSKVESEAEGLE